MAGCFAPDDATDDTKRPRGYDFATSLALRREAAAMSRRRASDADFAISRRVEEHFMPTFPRVPAR